MQVPELLQCLRAGDQSVLNELVSMLYSELRRIATRHLRSERGNHTLQTTALVHEAYVKLCEAIDRPYSDKTHFLAVASRVMRQVLVDYARGRATKKRERGPLVNLTISHLDSDAGAGLVELIELDDALNDLAQEDEALARLIEMRYFGGMTAEETAEALGISAHIVRHDVRLAHAWLRRRLGFRRQTNSAASSGV